MGRDFLFCFFLIAVGSLYVVVDRYFASRLPVGGVTSLNNAATFFSLVIYFGTAPLMIFLAKSSRLVAEEGSYSESFRETSLFSLGVAFAYCFPAGIGLAATATPLIRLLLGYGAYRDAVDLTSDCLVGYGLGIFFAVAGNIFYRIAQVRSMLPRVTLVSLSFVAVNGLLDWLFFGPLGAPGLALATTLTLGLSMAVYGIWLLPGFFGQLKRWRIGRQILLAAAWAFPLRELYRTLGRWDVLLLPLGGICLLAHYALCEHWGWLDHLPPRWRPSAFWRIAADRWTARKKS
jgi:peptidoglycan biosynthesis protein MviN/MurJ (putative lipid II flippase)